MGTTPVKKHVRVVDAYLASRGATTSNAAYALAWTQVRTGSRAVGRHAYDAAVTLGPVLQIGGAACELAGICTVAWGIAETRARFTDRPSLARRAWTRVSHTAARVFRRGRTINVEVHDSAQLHSRAKVRVHGTVGFGPWDSEALEERIERLRQAIESHEKQLNDLDSRIDDEERSRHEADARHEGRVNEVHRELIDLIREVAAGGLRLETIGVSLFALGVVLQTSGSLIS